MTETKWAPILWKKSMRRKMEGKGWEKHSNPTDQKCAEF